MRTCAHCKEKIDDRHDAYRDHAKRTFCRACYEKATGVKRGDG